MIDWYEFEQIIAKYFESRDYDVELNAKVRGRSGATYEIDVLAVDRNFNEIRIACQCKAWEKPVDRDHILHWSKVCEDIAAIPAFASTSGYTNSALAIARYFNFILLTYQDGSLIRLTAHGEIIERIERSPEEVEKVEEAERVAREFIKELKKLL